MPIRDRAETDRAPTYKGSFLIDPNCSPDRQDYRVCAESWSDDASKAFRHELEFPINQSLRELSGSGRYPQLRERLERLRVGRQAANRLILSIQIFTDRPDSGLLVADLNGLLISFTTIAPGETGFECKPVVRTGYRLELGMGHFAEDYVIVFAPNECEFIKLFAHGVDSDYEYPRNTRSGTGSGAVLSEDFPVQRQQNDSIYLARLKNTIEQMDNFRKAIKDEIQRNLNDYLTTQDPRTAEDKATVAAYINSVIDRLGFAIEYQGKQCNLNVTAGKKDQKGRFRLTPLTTRVHLTAPANLSELLPIHLIDPISPKFPTPPSPPEDSPTKWRDQVSQASKVSHFNGGPNS